MGISMVLPKDMLEAGVPLVWDTAQRRSRMCLLSHQEQGSYPQNTLLDRMAGCVPSNG